MSRLHLNYFLCISHPTSNFIHQLTMFVTWRIVHLMAVDKFITRFPVYSIMFIFIERWGLLYKLRFVQNSRAYPESKVHGTNMGPTLVMSAPCGPHVGLMKLAMWDPTKEGITRTYPQAIGLSDKPAGSLVWQGILIFCTDPNLFYSLKFPIFTPMWVDWNPASADWC